MIIDASFFMSQISSEEVIAGATTKTSSSRGGSAVDASSDHLQEILGQWSSTDVANKVWSTC